MTSELMLLAYASILTLYLVFSEARKVDSTYTQHKNIQEFLTFLSQHGALRSFLKEFEKLVPVNETINWSITSSKETFLVEAFVWRESKEGYRYWKDINLKWSEYLDK